MKKRFKIYELLVDLSCRSYVAVKDGHIMKNEIHDLTCSQLAEKCGVTPATITNLSTESSFSLVYNVAYWIFDAYYAYFDYDLNEERKNLGEALPDRDVYFMLWYMNECYTE